MGMNNDLFTFWTWHCCSAGYFGISIKKEYREIGVGGFLLQSLVEWAQENPRIEKICLKVHADNERAQHLYRKWGFKEEGRQMKDIKYGPDYYVDTILMGRFVEFQLNTPRLILRPHCDDDADFMVELNSNPEVIRYIGEGETLTTTMAQNIIAGLKKQFAEQQMGRFIVIEKESQRKIGWCGLKLDEENRIDLGYRFLQSEWGKGFATEAATRCLEYGFQMLGIKRITAWVAIENRASVHVLEKLGMTRYGTGFEHNIKCLKFFCENQ